MVHVYIWEKRDYPILFLLFKLLLLLWPVLHVIMSVDGTLQVYHLRNKCEYRLNYLNSFTFILALKE